MRHDGDLEKTKRAFKTLEAYEEDSNSRQRKKRIAMSLDDKKLAVEWKTTQATSEAPGREEKPFSSFPRPG